MEMVTETVGCLLCGVDDTILRATIDGWRVVCCRRCGLVYLNPRPAEAELEALYSEAYFCSMQRRTGTEDAEKGIAERTEDIVAVERFKRNGALLDIGCATGHLLVAARRRGWEITGIEFSEWAARIAKEQFGLEVVVGAVESLRLPRKRFDVITAYHVLEHLPDPLRSLEHVSRWMKDDGLLVIRLPNLPSFDAWYYKEQWEGWSVPFHFYHFSPKTLRRLLGMAGLQVMLFEFPLSPLFVNAVRRMIQPWKKTAPEPTPLLEHGNRGWEATAKRLFRKSVGRLFKGRDMVCYAQKGRGFSDQKGGQGP